MESKSSHQAPEPKAPPAPRSEKIEVTLISEDKYEKVERFQDGTIRRTMKAKRA